MDRAVHVGIIRGDVTHGVCWIWSLSAVQQRGRLADHGQYVDRCDLLCFLCRTYDKHRSVIRHVQTSLSTEGGSFIITVIFRPILDSGRSPGNIRVQHTQNHIITRMVQLPATAAIEYVAACWVSGAGRIFVRGCFCPGGLMPGGTFPRGSFARGDFCLGGLCPFPPSSMRIRTV